MKKKLSGLDIYVIFSITALIIYTIVSQIMLIKCGMQLDTLTTCFFGFFGGEIVTCALIKIFKLKDKPKQPVESVEEDSFRNDEAGYEPLDIFNEGGPVG